MLPAEKKLEQHIPTEHKLKLVQIFEKTPPILIVDRQVIIFEKNTPTEHKLKKLILLPPNQFRFIHEQIFSILENDPEIFII